MLDLLVVTLLVVTSVRAVQRIRRSMGGPIEDVPDAPADAEPMARVRYDDNGLVTYSFTWLPATFREEADVEDPEPT